jgi:hypothetical protein
MQQMGWTTERMAMRCRDGLPLFERRFCTANPNRSELSRQSSGHRERFSPRPSVNPSGRPGEEWIERARTRMRLACVPPAANS